MNLKIYGITLVEISKGGVRFKVGSDVRDIRTREIGYVYCACVSRNCGDLGCVYANILRNKSLLVPIFTVVCIFFLNSPGKSAHFEGKSSTATGSKRSISIHLARISISAPTFDRFCNR